MPLTFYRCEKCRREFERREDAERCEAAHLTVLEARVKCYGIHPYPYELEITFNNGATKIYLAETMH
ncbi:hypothetical protein FACS1894191_6660 [Clostridia bacterium]|nr:hypothetical protein FACS1894191_6660 [Clostridia bacterium]